MSHTHTHLRHTHKHTTQVHLYAHTMSYAAGPVFTPCVCVCVHRLHRCKQYLENGGVHKNKQDKDVPVDPKHILTYWADAGIEACDTHTHTYTHIHTYTHSGTQTQRYNTRARTRLLVQAKKLTW